MVVVGVCVCGDAVRGRSGCGPKREWGAANTSRHEAAGPRTPSVFLLLRARTISERETEIRRSGSAACVRILTSAIVTVTAPTATAATMGWTVVGVELHRSAQRGRHAGRVWSDVVWTMHGKLSRHQSLRGPYDETSSQLSVSIEVRGGTSHYADRGLVEVRGLFRQVMA